MLQTRLSSVIDVNRCVGKVQIQRSKRAIERPMRAAYDNRNGEMVVGEMTL